MNVDEILNKLASFLKFENPIELLIKLQDVGVIAGGCISDVLSGRERINDVDVFLLDSPNINYVSQIKEIFEGKSVTYSAYSSYSVLNVTSQVEGPDIQFIFSKATTMKEIAESFDMDFVVCAIHKFELYLPDKTIEQIETKTVTVYCHEALISTKRTFKAVQKGYSCYFFDWPQGSGGVYGLEDIDINTFVQSPFSRYVNTHRRDCEDFELTGIVYPGNSLEKREDDDGWIRRKNGENWFIPGQFVISYKKDGQVKYRLQTRIAMEFTILSIKNHICVIGELGSQIRQFDKVICFFGVNHLELDVKKSYVIEVFRTSGGLVNAKIVGYNEENLPWLPFPCFVELTNMTIEQKLELAKNLPHTKYKFLSRLKTITSENFDEIEATNF